MIGNITTYDIVIGKKHLVALQALARYLGKWDGIHFIPKGVYGITTTERYDLKCRITYGPVDWNMNTPLLSNMFQKKWQDWKFNLHIDGHTYLEHKPYTGPKLISIENGVVLPRGGVAHQVLKLGFDLLHNSKYKV